MISEGTDGKTESSGSLAMDGDKYTMKTKMVIDGEIIDSRIVKLGETFYTIYDSEKFIIKSTGRETAAGGVNEDYSGITLVNSGTGEINGRTLPYDEYADNDTGDRIKYYLDGGEVYAIETNSDDYKTVMIITNASENIPSGAFDLPSGYTEIDADQYSNFYDTFEIPDSDMSDYEMPDFNLPDGFDFPDGFGF